MKGIINFFKPKGMTSHGAVNFMRRKLNMKRIGHTGTLDPSVSGVLPLCIGNATRVSEYILDADKEYVGELTLGVQTDSQDMDGIAINKSDKKVSEGEIRDVFLRYIGDILQIPPMHSAVRHKGQRLYELAREGIEVERKKRHAHIYENEILSIKDNKVMFRIKCSKGTYIRTICNDIGEDLGTYGYMSYLIRTEVDIFKLEDSLGTKIINDMDMEDLKKHLIPMDVGARKLKEITLKDEDYFKITHGNRVELDNKYSNYHVDEDYRVYCKDEFIGIGYIVKEDGSKKMRMRKVLLT